MVGKEEMKQELQRREEEKRNRKREAGFLNWSPPWKTSPHPNLELESSFYVKVCVFIKEMASLISWHISSWKRRWGIAGIELHDVICDRNLPSLTFLVSLQMFVFFFFRHHPRLLLQKQCHVYHALHVWFTHSATRHPHTTYWPP